MSAAGDMEFSEPANARVATLAPEAAARALGRRSLGWIATITLGVFAINILFSRYLFPDGYLDLAGGRYIASHGIPHKEVFTLEGMGRPWIDQQWLAHWTFYETWAAGGYRLLAVFSSVLVAAGFMGLAALMVRRGVPVQRVLLWTALGYTACMGNTVIRAQSFAYPLFVLVFAAILHDAERRRLAWSFPLVLLALALWANLHGTVALGIMVFGGYAAWRALESTYRRRLRDAVAYAVVAAAAPLTLFANPYGFSILSYYRALVNNPVLKQYTEWAPPNLANPYSWGFFGLLIIVGSGVVAGLRRRRPPDLVLLAVSAGLLVVAFQGLRYQAWFALAACLLAADSFRRFEKPPPDLDPRFVRAGAAVVCVFAIVVSVVLVRTPDSQFETLSPRGAIDAAAAYVTAHPTAKVLADEGSMALLWRQPITTGRIAFDARPEQYPQERVRQWFQFFKTSTPDWYVLTRRYNVIVATRRSHPELVRRLDRLTGWRILYKDRAGSAYVRG